MHIPKTGGSAVRSALGGSPGSYVGPTYMDGAMVGDMDVRTFPPTRRTEFASASALGGLCRTHRLVMGHYGAQTLLDAGCRRLATQVREPRSRLLSLYRFWQAHLKREAASWGPWDEVIATSGRPLEAFLAAPAASTATDNAMTRQLLVQGTSIPPTQTRRLCEDALRDRGRYARLSQHLSIVEWMADSQRFIDRILASVPDAVPVQVSTVNEGVVVGEPQVIGPACRGLLEDHSRLDKVMVTRLMSDGHLPHRPDDELDAEFEDTARRLEFTFG